MKTVLDLRWLHVLERIAAIVLVRLTGIESIAKFISRPCDLTNQKPSSYLLNCLVNSSNKLHEFGKCFAMRICKKSEGTNLPARFPFKRGTMLWYTNWSGIYSGTKARCSVLEWNILSKTGVYTIGSRQNVRILYECQLNTQLLKDRHEFRKEVLEISRHISLHGSGRFCIADEIKTLLQSRKMVLEGYTRKIFSKGVGSLPKSKSSQVKIETFVE